VHALFVDQKRVLPCRGVHMMALRPLPHSLAACAEHGGAVPLILLRSQPGSGMGQAPCAQALLTRCRAPHRHTRLRLTSTLPYPSVMRSTRVRHTGPRSTSST
jgi:hypothetical protein